MLSAQEKQHSVAYLCMGQSSPESKTNQYTAGNPGVRERFSRQPRRDGFFSRLGATLVARRRVNNSGKVLAQAYVAKMSIWLKVWANFRAASVAIGAMPEDAGEGFWAGVFTFLVASTSSAGWALCYELSCRLIVPPFVFLPSYLWILCFFFLLRVRGGASDDEDGVAQ